jgi:uncharacterized membrane protein
MKKVSKLIICFVVATLFFLISIQITQAKDFYFKRINIDTTVNQDGSMKINEERTFSFNGDFHWAVLHIKKTGFSDIKDVSVQDDSNRYTETNDNLPHTFSVEDTPSDIYIRFNYNASNEDKTFKIDYTLTDVIKAFPDTAELYYKFIGEDTEVRADLAKVTVHLPEGATKNQIKVFGHGPLNGEVKVIDAQTVDYQVLNLPAKTFLEARILFPTKLVPLVPVSGKPSLDKILKEERALAKQTDTQKTIAKFAVGTALLIPVFCFLIFLYLYIRYGREHKTDFEGEYYRELPTDDPPALVGYLYKMGLDVGTHEFIATIMDLARRGYIFIDDISTTTKTMFGQKTTANFKYTKKKEAENSLNPIETQVMDILFRQINQGSEVTLKELKDYAKDNKVTFQNTFNRWKKTVKKEGDLKGYYEKASTNASIAGGAVGFACIALSVLFLFIHYSVGLMIFGIFVGILTIVLSRSIKRRSQQGVTDFYKWRAFKKYLEDFSKLDDVPTYMLAIWEQFLVYAVVFGIAKKVIDQLKVYIPQVDQEHAHLFASTWYASPQGSGLDSLDSLSLGVSEMVTAAATSVASSTGGGGGFSGGGGGGGGGGGVSAG